MVLTLVGLGLNDERDVSIRGLEAIRAADILYLENYTATLNVDTNRLVSSAQYAFRVRFNSSFIRSSTRPQLTRLRSGGFILHRLRCEISGYHACLAQERFFEKPIILADRDFVEGSAEAMLEAAKTKRVACLVVGDPFWLVC